MMLFQIFSSVISSIKSLSSLLGILKSYCQSTKYFILFKSIFRMNTGYRVCQCIILQWEAACFMDTNPLSWFDIGRDTVNSKKTISSVIKDSYLYTIGVLFIDSFFGTHIFKCRDLFCGHCNNSLYLHQE